jgi:hypothetical protein
MMLNNIIFYFLVASCFFVFSQSSLRDILNNQYADMYYLNKDAGNFRARGTENLGTKFGADSNSDLIIFRSYFKQE